MNRNRLLLIGGLSLVVAGLIGGSLTGSGSAAGGWWDGHMSGMPMMGWTGGNTAPLIPGAEEVIVELDEFVFIPVEVTLEAGTESNLTAVNEGSLVHDLTIPSLGVRIVVPPGGRASAGLRGLASGSYPFLCTVPGHAEAGMTGTLIVEQQQDRG